MDIRFKNARILSMKDNTDVINGEVWVHDDRISYVGSELSDSEMKQKNVKFDRTIDCNGNVLMPGFKNCHTHSAMTGMRSYADDLPLQQWLETMIFPIEAKLDGEMVYEFARLAILEYLTSGVTSIFDMYMFPDFTAKACNDMGMRLVMCDGINKFGPTIEELENRYNRLNNLYPLVKYYIGFHAEYTCTRELLESISDIAHKYKSPVYTHNAETALEVKECLERYNMTPTQLFDEIGLYDFGGGGYHCVHMSEADFEIFNKRKLSAVLNPGSNTKLASGVAPVKKYLKEGINIALGTDGPSSNNCLDMFREMFLVTGTSKLKEKSASVVRADEVIKMATVNGAKALYLDDCDILAEGKKADMIMLDVHQPNMQPIVNNIVSHIVYSGSKMNIKMTMIDGKILYEDYKFIGVDAEEIYDNCNRLITDLKGRL